MAPGKRKRNDRTSVDSGESRPSPHRPGNTTMGQHDRGPDMRNGRRPSRGGRGGGRGPRSERRNSSDIPNNIPAPQRGTPGPMSPPILRSLSVTQTQPQAPATTPSPAPVEDTPPPEAKKEPSPYDYSHLTDERVTAWSTTGRREVVEAGLQALDDLDVLDLSSIFQELVRAVLDRRIDASDAGVCAKEILTTPTEDSPEKIDGSTLFLDSVSIIADTQDYDSALQRLLLASSISPNLMRQTLDATLLQNLGLTRNTFIKAGIRQVTNILYRQANHNLLREETEGYSKLVTELFTTSGSEPPTSEVVEDTFERVKGLIGTFDLDVGRVLDVTLDVFAAVLIKQFRFFIKFLRVSSWWPRDSGLRGLAGSYYDTGGLPKWALPGSSGWTTIAEDEEANIEQREERDRAFWDRAREVGLDAFFELGGRHPIGEEIKKPLLAGKIATDPQMDGDLQWIEVTGTVPPPGNRVAAQLLGFKLRFYASEAREKDDMLPANLIYLAALLIKIGFISLRDLYPHLWPLDEDMPAVKDARMKELAEKERLNRPGATKNALMTAGALADDMPPAGGRIRETTAVKPDAAATTPTVVEDKPKEMLPEPQDQKVQLLTNLLTIGALPESLFMLGRFPWLPEAHPEIYDLLHRILHHSINKVYEASEVAGIPAEDCPGKKIADVDQGSAPKGQVRRTEITQRKPLRWPFPDKWDTNEGMVYRFYWDEWADNIPICQTVDDIFILCGTLLNYSGVNIGRDASLLSKFATIGNKSLSQDHSETNLARWQDLLKRLLVPALSLTKSNTSVVNEVYDMLRYYPSPVRFSIYAEWFEGATSRQPAIVNAFSRARLETLGTVKRMAKENISLMARTLAKTAYGNPGIAFKVALGQMQSYPNLIEVLVDCAKYFTDLGYDVLIWSLMSSLGDKVRSHTRADSALLTSKWLIALSKFTGRVFRKYSIMNPGPILQYVNDQLYRGNSTDLIILEELIGQMSGVVPDTDFTDSQLAAMTGGEILRRQTLINLHDLRFESTRSAKRLMRSLTETKLAGELLISVAQHRQTAIYAVPDEDAHIKYLATMVDETQRVLVQYLDLLRSNLSIEEFDALVPNTAELMADFGLEPPLAFLVGRASYVRRMAILEAPSAKDIEKDIPMANETTNQVDGEGDITIKQSDTSTNPRAEDVIEGASMDSKHEAQINGQFDGSDAAISPLSSTDTWREALMPLMQAVQAVLPEATWDLLNPEFYVVFWQLSLADVFMPMESYTVESQRLTKEISEIMKDRSDMSRQGMARKEESRRALDAAKDELLKESKQQMIKYERTRTRLNKEKLEWFNNIRGNFDGLADAILEKCFLPRLLLSPSDADYCFRFLKFLHGNGTPNFRTLALYVHLFRENRLRSIIFSCTIREAENFGRFLKNIFGELSKWHASKSLYEREALGPNRDFPGFAAKMNEGEKPSKFLDYEEFRRLLYKFHTHLHRALHACLTGMEWMHIRNAITVLKAVVDHFPAVNFMGNKVIDDLKEIAKREQNSREDLALLANAVMPELIKRKPKWVMVQAFATNINAKEQQNGVKPVPVQSNTPEIETSGVTSKSTLKPTAPEFRPQPRVTSNGTSALKPAASNEVEDGEVDDAKTPVTAQPTENALSTEQPAPNTTSSNISLAPASNSQSISLPATAESPPRERTPPGNPASQAGPPPRLEIGRNPSATSVLEKPHPGLPSRPDVPFPSHIPPDRHMPSRQGDRRDVHQNRPDRPSDGMRDRARESSNFERRGPEPPRDLGRPSERSITSERDRDRDRHDSKRRGLEPLRDNRDSRDSRDHRDRGPLENSRLPDLNGRLSRNDDMLPPRSIIEASQGSALNPDLPINPARAAQIFGTSEVPRSESARVSRDDHRDRPSSRPHSPQRDRYHSIDRDHSEARRNDRPLNRRPPLYAQEYPRGRHDDPQPNPAGSRGDWVGDRGPYDRLRDSSAFQPTPPPSRPVDPDHGRLIRSQPDPNFGRLNPAPASQIPSGPSRDRGNRSSAGGSRLAGAPQQRFDSRPSPQELARPPTPDKQPPTGPAATRAPRHAGPSIFEPPASTALSTPTTPAVSSPTAGVHPERLRHIDPTVAQQATLNAAAQASLPPPATPSTIPTGVHPSRLQAFQEDQAPARQGLPPIQTSNINSSAPRPPSPLTAGPPSGPKSLQSVSNSIMSPNGITPPTGPSLANDRSRGNIMRQVQNTINQSEQRAAPNRMSDRISIRGRSSRNSIVGLGPDLPSAQAPLASVSMPPGRDLLANGPGDRSRDLVNPDRSMDLFSSRAVNGADNERDRERERADSRSGLGTRREGGRSGRHSRRNSRSRSPARDAERERDRDRVRERGGGPMDEGGRGEYRDRGIRSGGGDSRDRRQGEREIGSRRDGEKGRDLRDIPPRPGNEPDWGGGGAGSGGGSGGGIGPGAGLGRRDVRLSSDGRRDTRSDGSGRKRRGEEGGIGPDNRGHEKRPRR